VTLAISFGVWYSYSVFFLAILKEFGWSRAATSSIFSVFLLSQAFSGMPTGYLMDRYGPRLVIPSGAVVLAASLALVSCSRELWHFQISFGICAAVGVGLTGFVSHTSFLPRWFERKRGLAMGIAMSGIGLGTLVMVPVAERLITLYGWRTTYVILAAIVFLVATPLNAFLTRGRPEDLGLRPDGDGSPGPTHNAAPKRVVKVVDPDWVRTEWRLGNAILTRRFWFMVVAWFFGAYTYQSILLHAVSAIVDAGLSRQAAAYYFGVLGILGSVGKVFFGHLSDALGRERTNTVAAAITTLGVACLIWVHWHQGPLPLLFAVLFGLGYGASAPLLPSIGADIFLGRSFGLIFATISIGGGLGGAAGSYSSGFLRDAAGTYTVPFLLVVATLWTSCLFVWLAAPRKIRRMVQV